MTVGGEQVAPADPVTALAIENVAEKLKQFGVAGTQFETACNAVRDGLKSKDHDTFCRGLESLGRLLGFESEIPGGDAAPDGLWNIAASVYIAFEVKTEESPGDAISPAECRQASGHASWVRVNRTPPLAARLTATLVTPRSTVAKAAFPHAGDLYRVDPEVIRSMAVKVIAVLRQARAEAGGADDELLQEKLRQLYSAAGLISQAVGAQLRTALVTSLKVQG